MTPQVPLFDLTAQYASIRDEVLAAISRVCDSQQFILGPEVEALERELSAYLAAPNAVAVSSGTDALLMALMALGVGPGDEVITPAFSFFATAGSIARVGARPVFVDIDPATFNIDSAAIDGAVTPRTKAVIPVHLFGQSADMAPIVKSAASRGISIVEDAAQAIGARYQDRPAGTFGEMGCFSFFPTKNLGAFGDGGLIVCHDAGLAARLRAIRNHGAGAESKYRHDTVGGNFRMDAIQAAILRVKLAHLPGWTVARQQNAARYEALFEGAGLIGRVAVPARMVQSTHIYNQFVIRVPRRDELRQHLRELGIGTEIYYPTPLHLQPCFTYLDHAAGDFPVSEAASREVLALPIYGELAESQQARVVEAIRLFFQRA
jgi:dTDP-4-amino-4,6-dideoxygalactose transaminase